MTQKEFPVAISQLKKSVHEWAPTAIAEVSSKKKSPFRVLISCILSLRTKDNVTAQASERLFQLADSPDGIIKLHFKTIEKAIYPVGFYHTKAKVIKNISRILLEKYDGRVPDELDELLKLKGVGRKTANLVITIGFGKPGICVDTHVHRIFNRWGYISTKSPNESEFALREKLPKRYWIEINDLLVSFGQNLCKPISPHCSKCPIYKYCKRAGVTKTR